MIKIEIYEDTGQFIANGAAIELLKEEEYQQIDELAKKLKSRIQNGKAGVEHESN